MIISPILFVHVAISNVKNGVKENIHTDKTGIGAKIKKTAPVDIFHRAFLTNSTYTYTFHVIKPTIHLIEAMRSWKLDFVV